MKMTTDRTDVKTRLWHCLERSVAARSRLEGVTEETNLFEDAVIDSLATVALISEIEKEFDVELNENDVFGPSFATLAGIAELIEQRRH